MVESQNFNDGKSTFLTEFSNLDFQDRLRDLRRGRGSARSRTSGLSGRTNRGAFISTRSGGFLSYRNRIIIGGAGTERYIVSQ